MFQEGQTASGCVTQARGYRKPPMSEETQPLFTTKSQTALIGNFPMQSTRVKGQACMLPAPGCTPNDALPPTRVFGRNRKTERVRKSDILILTCD